MLTTLLFLVIKQWRVLDVPVLPLPMYNPGYIF